jgi:hypothetical protein
MKPGRTILTAIAVLASAAIGAAQVRAGQDDAGAAKVQTCASTIAACGCTINKRGIYTLSADLSIAQGQTSDGDCIDVTAPHALLFLNGFGIDGAGTGNGLHLKSGANNFFVEGANSAGGFAVITHFASGVTIQAANGTIEDFTSAHNTGAGVVMKRAGGNRVVNFAVKDNPVYGVWLIASSNNRIHGGVLDNNGTGLFLGCSGTGPDGKKCRGIAGSNNNRLFNLGAGESKDMTSGNSAYGVAIDLGNTGNFITGNQSYFNPAADLLDNNSNCGKNFWIHNRFQTSAPVANAGCLR